MSDDDIKDSLAYASNTTQPITTWSGSTANTTSGGLLFDYTTPNYVREETSDIKDVYYDPLNPNNMKLTIMKGGDDDMRYLYEVILVNPKNDTFFVNRVIARSETSALMKVYNQYKDGFVGEDTCGPFDDLKTSCRVLMEWKKEKSLKKAIETIKEAVE